MNDLQLVAYNAIVTGLTESRAFETVLLDVRGRQGAGSQPSPLAVVAPGSWTDSMTDDPATLLRKSSYRVVLLVRADDPRARFAESNRLAGEASALLIGANFGDGCLPSLSRIERGEYLDAPGSGEASCELRGTFSFLISAPLAESPEDESPEPPEGPGVEPDPVGPGQN